MTLPNSNTRIEQYLSEISEALKALSGSSQSAKMYYSIESAQILYFNEDGSELLHTEPVAVGDSGMWDGAPEKEPDEKYEYTFQGWAKTPNKSSVDADAVENVTSTRKVYASYQKRHINDYLTFSSESRFSIITNMSTKSWDGSIYYSTDAIEWTEWDSKNIDAGKKNSEYVLYMRGVGNTRISTAASQSGPGVHFVLYGGDSPKVKCDGNIETLLDYEIVKNGGHPEMSANCYAELFYGSNALVAAPDLPATTLVEGCYKGMFHGCSVLKAAPALPATTLAKRCYESMFYGCSGLTEAPELPAMSLADFCYLSMFKESTGLTKAPALPAAELKQNCYTQMFFGCTGLQTIPALPATTLTGYCYSSMFQGCTGIKLSKEPIGEYAASYRIPESGTGTIGDSSLTNMFKDTGGTFTGTPEINTTYYLANQVVPAAG